MEGPAVQRTPPGNVSLERDESQIGTRRSLQRNFTKLCIFGGISLPLPYPFGDLYRLIARAGSWRLWRASADLYEATSLQTRPTAAASRSPLSACVGGGLWGHELPGGRQPGRSNHQRGKNQPRHHQYSTTKRPAVVRSLRRREVDHCRRPKRCRARPGHDQCQWRLYPAAVAVARPGTSAGCGDIPHRSHRRQPRIRSRSRPDLSRFLPLRRQAWRLGEPCGSRERSPRLIPEPSAGLWPPLRGEKSIPATATAALEKPAAITPAAPIPIAPQPILPRTPCLPEAPLSLWWRWRLEIPTPSRRFISC